MGSWNREHCIQALDEFVRKHGRTPRSAEWHNENGLPSTAAFKRWVGDSCHSYCKERYPGVAHPTNYQQWDRDSCIRALEEFMQAYGRMPKPKEQSKAFGLPSSKTFMQSVGIPYHKYIPEELQYLQEEPQHPREEPQWTGERCIQQLDAFITVNGRRPSRKEYKENPELPDATTFRHIMGERPDKYIDRHYDVPAFGSSYPLWSPQRCEAAIRRFISETGRRPVAEDFAEHDYLALPPIFANYLKQSYDDYLNTAYPQMEMVPEPLASYWTPAWCELACERFIQSWNRAPRGYECDAKHGLPVTTVITKLMGKTVMEMQRERFPDQVGGKGSPGSWTDEQIHEAIRGWVNEHGRLPHAADLKISPGTPHQNTIRNHFGLGLSEYLDTFFSDIPREPQVDRRVTSGITREACAGAIAAFIRENSYTPVASNLKESIGISDHREFQELMGTPLSQYLEENHPGVQYGRQKVYTRKECEEAYRRFVEAHGYLPNRGDFAIDGTLPNIMTFTRHTGMTPTVYGMEHFPHLSSAQRVWTKEMCTEALERFIARNDRLPTITEYGSNHGLPPANTFQSVLGVDYAAYLAEHYSDMPIPAKPENARRIWNRASCIQALESRMGRLPQNKIVSIAHILKAKRMPSSETFELHVGQSYSEYIQRHFPGRIRQHWNRETCTEALEAYVARCREEKRPTGNPWEEPGMPSAGLFAKFVGCTYRQYLNGLRPEQPRGTWNRESCIAAIEKCVRGLETRELVEADIKSSDMPDSQVFRKHVGMGYLDYCRVHHPDLRIRGGPSLSFWDRQSCVEAVDAHIKALGKQELSVVDFQAQGLPDSRTFRKFVGTSLLGYCRMRHPNLKIRGGHKPKTWSRVSCIVAVDRRVRELMGKGHIQMAEFNAPGIPSAHTFLKYTGKTILEYVEERYPHVPMDVKRRHWNQDSCIAAIDAFINNHGRLPQGKEINRAAGLSTHKTFLEKTGMRYTEYFRDKYPELYTSGRLHVDSSRCQAAVGAFIEQHGRLPEHNEINGAAGFSSRQTFRKKTGMSYTDYFRERYPELYADSAYGKRRRTATKSFRWDRESCLAALDAFINAHGRLPERNEINGAAGFSSRQTFRKKTGMSYTDYFRKRYPDLYADSAYRKKSRTATKSFRWDRESCIAALDAFINAHGRLPERNEINGAAGFSSRQAFRKNTGMSYTDYFREKYPELYADSAYGKRSRTATKSIRWDRESCLAAVTDFVEINGRLPNSREHGKQSGLPGERTFRQLMGMTIVQCAKERFPQLHTARVRWDADRCIKALEDFIRLHGRTPHYTEYSPKCNLPNEEMFKKYIGQSYARYFKENCGRLPCDAQHTRSWDKGRCLEALDAFVKEHGALPSVSAFASKNGLPNPKTFERYVGIPCGAYISEHYPELRAVKRIRIWSKERCEQALAAFVEQHGRTPTQVECKPGHGLPNSCIFLSHVGQSYRQYIQAHYPDRITQTTWNKERCIHALTEYIKANGCVPSNSQCTKASGLPNANTFTKHLEMSHTQYAQKHMGDLLKIYAQEGAGWNRDKCIAALDTYIRETGKAPKQVECRSHNGLASTSAFIKHVGMTYTQYIRDNYPRLPGEAFPWSRERCEAALTAFVTKTGRAPQWKDCRAINGLPSYSAFQHHMGMGPMRYANERFPHLMRPAGPHPAAAQIPAGGERREPPQEKNTAREPTTAPQPPKRRATKRKREEPAQSWNRESTDRALKGFVKAHGRFPKEEEFTPENGLPSLLSAKRMLDCDYSAMHRDFTVAYLREQAEAALAEQEAPDSEEAEQSDLAFVMNM